MSQDLSKFLKNTKPEFEVRINLNMKKTLIQIEEEI